jgi:hypothetical protein
MCVEAVLKRLYAADPDLRQSFFLKQNEIRFMFAANRSQHEIFVAPKGHWESIYINSEPLGLGAATFPVKTETGTMWQNSLVDASRGVLRSSKGRMTLSDGMDHEMYSEDPYNGRV